MNKKLVIVIALFSTASLVGCGKGFPVMGINEKGEAIVKNVDSKMYSAQLQSVLGEVQVSALSALNQKGNSNETKKPMELSTVVVGVGLVGEAGLGDTWKYTVEPRLRFVLTNRPQATIP